MITIIKNTINKEHKKDNKQRQISLRKKKKPLSVSIVTIVTSVLFEHITITIILKYYYY